MIGLHAFQGFCHSIFKKIAITLVNGEILPKSTKLHIIRLLTGDMEVKAQLLI
ncbi:hypothetical protein [Metabacillus fastidiosus]|uniref:hypothetical protein n=1 Tax=Metabacillus fastidiosus TaxID=1458 RepID=UPI002DBAB360|nr:hypothetical protein [Metabacillus fastidiosus]MEC2078070.1 hypothetical protein [Metabacillus fastidiosus]